jgi:hypothetical protein
METKEQKIIEEAQLLLDTDEIDNEWLKEGYKKLLKEYKKLSRRVDKIIKMNDRFEKTVNLINDSLVEDKKERSKKVIEQKQKILTTHREQRDELQAIIKKREEEVAYYKAIIEENELLRGQVSSNKLLNESMDSILEQYSLDKDTIEQNLSEIIEELIEDGSLDFAHIDVNYFEEEHLLILQKSIQVWLSHKGVDKSDSVALSNYFLRERYEKIHETLAYHILKGMMGVKKAYGRFLQGYSGEVYISSNGKRYKHQEIVDKKGNKWSEASITSFLRHYTKNVTEYEAKEEQLLHYKNELEKSKAIKSELKKSFDINRAEKNELKKYLDSVDREIAAKRETLWEIRNSKKIDKEKIESVKAEIKELTKGHDSKQEQYKKVQAEENSLVQKHKDAKQNCEFYLTEISKIEALQKSQEDGYIVTKNRYNLLLEALSLVLMRKKSKLKDI